MASNRLPIAGFPHLFLAAQDSLRIREKTLDALRRAGFTIEPGRLVPPKNATGKDVIAAITAAFQHAKC